MTQRKDWTGQDIPALGMGCWAIGGPMFTPEGGAVGWGPANDPLSLETIFAAYEAGLRVFDTAQAYGTGHSEALLGRALADKPDARIVTKVGLGIAPATRHITGAETAPDQIRASLEASRQRLRRDRIELVLLHLNDLPLEEARPVFDTLEDLRHAGWLTHFGWSTDFPDRASAFADLTGYAAIEHAMNLFVPATAVTGAATVASRVPLIRSPLAMGLLGGRITEGTQMPSDDVRGNPQDWNAYFVEGRPNPDLTRRLAAVREILTAGGRSLAQGALAWIWARSPTALPVPGMRTPMQVADLAGALERGPLEADQMSEIEALMDRPPEGPPQAR